jgi:hypothetical protein
MTDPGDLISWQRADNSMHHGIVDLVHIDAEDSMWAFVSTSDGWSAVNMKYAKMKL